MSYFDLVYAEHKARVARADVVFDRRRRAAECAPVRRPVPQRHSLRARLRGFLVPAWR